MSQADEMILEALRGVAEQHKRSPWELCQGVWKLMQQQSEAERERYFRVFLQEIDLSVLEESGDGNLPQPDEDCFTEADAIADKVLKNLLLKNPQEADFYHTLWEKFCDSLLFSDEAHQIAFLMRLWMDLRIPYFHRDSMGLKMDDAEFQAIFEKILPVLKKAQFLLVVRFEQKTQRTSLLIELANSLASDAERAVFWAFVISRITLSERRIAERDGAKREA